MHINQLLDYAIDHHASDLHLVPQAAPWMRVDGVLLPMKEYTSTLSADAIQRLLYDILSTLQQATFEKQLVLEFAYSIKRGHFRVSMFHQMHGMAAVFRIVPSVIPSFASLNAPAVLKPLLSSSRGLILLSGPTGSGKSTTLAAMIDYINQNRICHIITIEDPVEFIHPNKRCIVNQIQVGRDALSFASALRASLRQDPNVILLGELRDLETMRLALTAVETGHLVLATIHAASAPLSVSRFADVFPLEEQNRVRVLLSETLEGVVCQRLVKKKASKGRVAVFEVMLITQAMRNYIRRDMPAHMESAIQTGGEYGMITFENALTQLVQKNLIAQTIAEATLKEIRSFASNYQQGAQQGAPSGVQQGNGV